VILIRVTAWVGWLAVAVCVGCGAGSESPLGKTAANGEATTAAPNGGLADHAVEVSHALRVRFVTDYREGLERALAEKRPVLVFFTAKWCRFCAQMEQEALRDPRVVRLSEEFVCVLVDADEAPELCAEFGVRAYPTVQFILPDGGRMARVVGRNSPEELAGHMQAALRAAAHRLSTRNDYFTR